MNFNQEETQPDSSASYRIVSPSVRKMSAQELQDAEDGSLLFSKPRYCVKGSRRAMWGGIICVFAIVAASVVSIFYISHQSKTEQQPAGNFELKLTPHTISVMGYNDVYQGEAQMENGVEKGGAIRFATAVKAWRKATPHGLLLFAGDTLSPSLASKLFHGTHMIDIHNELMPDASCLGNHEFDESVDNFVEAAKKSKFPWLNANAYETRTQKLIRNTVPHIIKVVNNVTVGIFGVMYDMEDASKGLYFTSPIKAGQEQVALLRSKGADMVIALTHMDWEDDNGFAKAVDVDLIIGGHDHDAMLQTQFGAPYVKAHSDFFDTWITSVKLDSRPFEFDFRLLSIDLRIPEDLDMKALVHSHMSIVDRDFGEVVGTLCADLDLREHEVRFKESPVANFMADAQRFITNPPVNVSIMNGGGIRTNRIHPKGPVTKRQVVEWTPFDNNVVVLNINGSILRSYVLSEASESCGGLGSTVANGELIHVSGFHYVYECENAGIGKLIEFSWDNLNERPIRDDEEFTIAVNDYSYNRRKTVLQNAVVTLDTPKGIDSAMFDMIEASPKREICPSLEGRFKIIESSHVGHRVLRALVYPFTYLYNRN